MSGSRNAFLQRVREAVQLGNRPGIGTEIPARGRTGYQGAGPDPVTRFREQCTAAGGHVQVVPDAPAMIARALDLVRSKSARRILLGRGAFLDSLAMHEHLRQINVEVVVIDSLDLNTSREPFFAADVGISGTDYLIAETGSVALLAKPSEPRSLSLLPPVHIVLASREQIVPDLFDLFDERLRANGATLPSCLTLITGPSKTGDIELRLVTGVHGPGELHVVFLDG